jgi:hypothetical protein
MAVGYIYNKLRKIVHTMTLLEINYQPVALDT